MDTAPDITRHWPAISVAAARHGLRAALLAGLAAAESGGNPDAVRYEPSFRWVPADYAEHRPAGMSAATELIGRKTSWGLCQVMGQVARERGFTGWWPELCRPEAGLRYGAAHLAWCLRRRGGDVHAALLLYNGGGDPDYPGRVLAWAKHF